MLSLVPTQRADPLGLAAHLQLVKVALLERAFSSTSVPQAHHSASKCPSCSALNCAVYIFTIELEDFPHILDQGLKIFSPILWAYGLSFHPSVCSETKSTI